jgi:gliding motility-associated-like protein
MRGFVLLFACLFLTCIQLHGQRDIIFRNNCITQCANCDAGQNPDMATVFELNEVPPAGTTYLWDFGEPNTPGNTSVKATGIHQYCSPGKKTVTLTLSKSGSSTEILKKDLIIGQLPYVYLGKDRNDTTKTICKGQGLVLEAFGKVGRPNYPVEVSWFPGGETTDNIKADSSGCYSVQVKDIASGCTTEAKMQLKVCGEMDPFAARVKNPYKIWCFGNGAGLIFIDRDNPTPTICALSAPNGVAKMEDASSASGLIFYTDGVTVYDSTGVPIDPLKKLNGEKGNSQGVTIIPKTTCKGCQSEYYVFTLSKNAAGENLIYYSIVDMKLNQGRGGISELNKLLSPVPTTSRILASQGGKDFYWLITQDANSNITRNFKISSAGISQPINSIGGTTFTSVSGSNGTTKISPDWTKMAITVPGPPTNKIDLYDLNPITGNPTFWTSIDLGASPPTVYGVEYSADKKALYVSMLGDGSSVKSQILQFDISNNRKSHIDSSKVVVFETTEKIGALQIDPIYNNIIFIAFQGSDALGKITSTNGLINANTPTLLQAKFERKGVVFPTTLTSTLGTAVTSELGLPATIPFPPTSQNIPKIKLDTCLGKVFKFKVDQKLCDPIENSRIDWKIYQTSLSLFPNPAGLMVPKDSTTIIYKFTGPEMSFQFKKSDTYVITASISNICKKDYLLDGEQFVIDVLEPLSLAPEFNRICKTNATIQLDSIPPSRNLVFEWSNGQKTRTATIPNPGGDLSVIVTDTASGCQVKASTKVNFLTNKMVMPPNDFSICMDEPVPFTIMLNTSQKDLVFDWTGPGGATSTTNQIRVNQNGNYDVKITDKEGCIMPNTFPVADRCDATVVAPTIFTPNGDGKNDYFIPKPKSDPRTEMISLQIYNRWGEMLYTQTKVSSSEELKWNGLLNGKMVPQESYVWVVNFKAVDYPNKGIQTQRGAVIVAY